MRIYRNEWLTCGAVHSLLLSKDGFIYWFGNGMSGRNQFKPEKLNHEKRFIDIASHWNEGISIALSFDNVYY